MVRSQSGTLEDWDLELSLERLDNLAAKGPSESSSFSEMFSADGNFESDSEEEEMAFGDGFQVETEPRAFKGHRRVESLMEYLDGPARPATVKSLPKPPALQSAELLKIWHFLV